VTSFFVLTSAEAVVTAEAIETLRSLPWAGALLARAGERGGLTQDCSWRDVLKPLWKTGCSVHFRAPHSHPPRVVEGSK
jgi:hypothetical protein